MPRKPKRQPTPSSVPPRKEPPGVPGWLRGLGDGRVGSRPAWKLSKLDLEYGGSWSWDLAGDDLREIVQFLQQMERLTWTEIRAQTTGGRTGHRKHHSIEIESLCPEAQRRLR